MTFHDDRALHDAVSAFVDALNNLDRERLRACFTDDATNFRPWGGPRQTDFWNERFEATRAAGPGPPYQNVQPRDVRVQHLGAVAVVSFHLTGNPGVLGRRTLVLENTEAGWKIAHLHASNLPLADEAAQSSQ